jgi:hypothetical protein
MASYSYSINFGTVMKTDYVSIGREETARLEALFWSRENTSKIVEIYVLQKPENVSVFVYPQSFILNGSSYDGQEYISSPSGEIAPAVPVDIVIATDNAEYGTSRILISARSITNEGNINFFQEQIISFSLDISEGRSGTGTLEKTGGGLAGESDTAPSQDVAKPEEETDTKYYLLIIVAIIIILSFIIYRVS